MSQFWPSVQEYVAASFRYRLHGHDASYVREACESGRATLWLAALDGAVVGCAVTGVEQEPLATTLTIFNLGGERFPDWVQELDEALTDYATAHGCHAIEYAGRAGFSKLAPGYAEDGRIYVKLLTSEEPHG